MHGHSLHSIHLVCPRAWVATQSKAVRSVCFIMSVKVVNQAEGSVRVCVCACVCVCVRACACVGRRSEEGGVTLDSTHPVITLHPPVNTPGWHPSSSRSESRTNLPFYFVLFPVCFSSISLMHSVFLVQALPWLPRHFECQGGFCWILMDSHMHTHTHTYTHQWHRRIFTWIIVISTADSGVTAVGFCDRCFDASLRTVPVSE